MTTKNLSKHLTEMWTSVVTTNVGHGKAQSSEKMGAAPLVGKGETTLRHEFRYRYILDLTFRAVCSRATHVTTQTALIQIIFGRGAIPKTYRMPRTSAVSQARRRPNAFEGTHTLKRIQFSEMVEERVEFVSGNQTKNTGIGHAN
ncbi:hypothetical protein U0C82_03945 [Fulvimarina sp. 2208YS6-2-32]|uniref:Uncharacterized protein n=1 Tax=Fulvimarina uroteuthidis TaxID=3098149 RepID=A0ABU5HYV7_9HYPH|nr:hypothetical protein [Fulvimarina sp. 2208YS6-2-32]MDY8108302.1 hypothetical protein [Fulvimarina sp. 2208YS6-2-32]